MDLLVVPNSMAYCGKKLLAEIDENSEHGQLMLEVALRSIENTPELMDRLDHNLPDMLTIINPCVPANEISRKAFVDLGSDINFVNPKIMKTNIQFTYLFADNDDLVVVYSRHAEMYQTC